MEFKPKLESKRWDKENEKVIWKDWKAKGVFKPRLDSGRPLFVIDTPPPYPSSV